MGATPSHQANTQALDHKLWEAEGILWVPPHLEGAGVPTDEEDMPTVKGGAVCASCIQEKCMKAAQEAQHWQAHQQHGGCGVAPPV